MKNEIKINNNMISTTIVETKNLLKKSRTMCEGCRENNFWLNDGRRSVAWSPDITQQENF